MESGILVEVTKMGFSMYPVISKTGIQFQGKVICAKP